MSDKILDKAIEEVVREMTPEERAIIKQNTKMIDEITPEERDVIIRIIERLAKLTPEERDEVMLNTATRNLVETARINLKLSGCRMEHNSFVVPITSDMCRTTKSYPCKGYTSVSRIAKG